MVKSIRWTHFFVRHFQVLSVLLLVCIAFCVRVPDIAKNPAGFFVDEASEGYNAYQIWNTGADEHGVKMPVFFRSFGDFKSPVYVYTAAPVVGLLGLNVFTIRLVSVLYGTAACIAVYLLGRELHSHLYGLIAGYILAVMGWHIHFSRVGFEMIAYTFWAPFALWLLLKATRSVRLMPLAMIVAIVPFFTYVGARLSWPLICLCFVLVYMRKFVEIMKTKQGWGSLIIAGVIFALLIVPAWRDGSLLARYKQINATGTIKSKEVIAGYLAHFSPDFLITKGESDYEGQYILRHAVRGTGEIGIWIGIAGLLSLLALRRPQTRKTWVLLALLILVSPVPTAFASNLPGASRSIVMTSFIALFAALGLYDIVSLIQRYSPRGAYIWLGVVALILAYQVGHYLKLNADYPRYASGYYGWQYGYEQIHTLFASDTRYTAHLVTHRYSSVEMLQSFFNVQIPCSTCGVISNPIKLSDTAAQAQYAIRKEDIEEATRLYPEYVFRTQSTIQNPGGDIEVYLGVFEKR